MSTAIAPQTLFTWLHLADLGIGGGGARVTADRGLTLDALLHDITHPAAGQPPIDAIFITGDLTASGHEGDLHAAETWIDTLLARLDLHRRSVYLVAGDRDRDRRNDGKGVTRLALKAYRGGDAIDEAWDDDDIGQALRNRRAAFRATAGAFAEVCAAPWWQTTRAAGGQPLRIVGLDTAALATADDPASPPALQLGKRPLDETLTGLDDGTLVITLAHHPPAALSDGADVARILDARAAIQLFGSGEADAIEARAAGGRRVVRITAGAAHDPDGGHHYAIGSLIADTDGALAVRIWPRRFSPKRGDFRPDRDLTDGTEPWVEHHLDRRIGPAVVEPQRDAILDAYRARMRSDHKRLVPFFRGTGDNALARVFVDLHLVGEHFPSDPERLGERDDALLHKGRLQLADLLEAGGRWAVLGDPGAGKSTIARHLTYTRAGEPDGPLPLLIPLARLAREGGDPFALAERATGLHGIADRLRRLAAEGGLWMLLDGLDEVPGNPGEGRSLGDIRRDIEALAERWPAAPMVVLSRPIGYQTLDGFRPARVDPLSDSQQRQLLDNWLGAEAGAEVRRQLRQRRRLRDEARNPLLLTLIAMLARAGRGLPPSRVQLYGQAVQLLLERGHCDESTTALTGMADPDGARCVLRTLCLDLQWSGQESWSRDDLATRLRALRDADEVPEGHHERSAWPREARGFRRALDACGGARSFLDDLARDAGILADYDGPAAPWRFLHRSLRERLAAEALQRRGPAAVAAAFEVLTDNPDDGSDYETLIKRQREIDEALPRWSLTLGMACSLLADPEAAIRRLAQVSGGQTRLILPETEGLAPDVGLALLAELPDWHGDHLLRLAESWPDLDAAERRLLALVEPGIDLDRLAWVHFALCESGRPPDRPGFFARAGRPIDPGIEPELRPIPGGAFIMGSPPDEQDRSSDEQQHRVILSAFEMAPTPVTVAEYRRFDPDHRSPGTDHHPVIEVSWWRARLYAAWVGCRLPTEAEWERACRAGTPTRYWSGDTEADLARVGWYAGNSGRRTHPVGEKPANRWGLHDMHGNVWEWCADGYGPYPEASAPPEQDPLAPPAGRWRVLRGGSGWNSADRARAAYRYHWHPALRGVDRGFRLARRPI